MLQRFALAAADDEFAEGGEFGVGKGALEVQVELHAGHFQQVGEEEFHLQARRVHAFFGEEIGALGDDFEDGHADNLELAIDFGAVLDAVNADESFGGVNRVENPVVADAEFTKP